MNWAARRSCPTFRRHEGVIGVDSRHKLIHLVAATAANVHDSHLLRELLQGNETLVWRDSAYQGKVEVDQCTRAAGARHDPPPLSPPRISR